MFAMTVFMTALLWVAFGSHTPTHAIDAASASWKGESILYDGHQYFNTGDTKPGNSLGLPQGAHYYVYIPEATGTVTPSKAFVLYFAPGTDPPTEKTVSSATYDYVASTKKFSNPTDKKTVDLTVKGSESSYSACTVQGIGWIICPVTTFLADGMDTIFNIVKSFLVVQPVNTTNANNDLYVAWNVMRGFANVAFIIVFMIIIYSQLTNAGISNYGLKKLLPRLIIAAILVNLSYLICATVLDISNILGYSLQDIFVNIRQSTFNISNDTWANSEGMGWSAVAAVVLSGGAATIGVLAATGGTAAGAVFLLIPILLGLIMTILLVLLILAARQAIIIILIVIAPLAFVAYLLPNTEQWFKKWRELFMTMLVFFPAFSLAFGGSQLAGGLIIQNATSIIGIIFGMAVQVAPLVITPLLLKLSGGLLGRIAGMVNDPKKGLLDRTKAWSGSRAEMHRRRGIGDPNLKRNQVFRRAARRMALSNDRVERNTERYKAGFEAIAAREAVSTRTGQKIEVELALAKLQTEELNKNMEQAVQELRAGDSSGLNRLRLLQEATTVERVRMRASGGTTTLEELRITNVEGTRRGARQAKFASVVMERAMDLDENSRAIESATTIAKNIQLTNYAKKIEDDTDGLRVRAGGIAGKNGQAGALAAAFKAQSAAHGDAVANANSILGHYNYGDDTVVKLARGIADGTDFSEVSDALREAAIVKIAGGANASAILDLMKNIHIDKTDENQDFRQAFADALLTNSSKPKFAGAGIIADIKQGIAPPPGDARINKYIVATVESDKFGSAETLVTQDRDYLEALEKAIGNKDSASAMGYERKATILTAIDTIRSNPIYSGKVGERKNALNSIERMLRAQTGILPPAPDPGTQGQPVPPAPTTPPTNTGK